MSNEEARRQAVEAGETAEADKSSREVQVGLQRSVRIGRIIIAGVVIGIALGAIASLFFPVAENADYSLNQVTGLMAVVGGVIGLALSAILALLLGIVAKRNHGAAIAVQTDVR